jgi:hypothetical protein
MIIAFSDSNTESRSVFFRSLLKRPASNGHRRIAV